MMKTATASPFDYLRQSANLILAPGMWLLSSIGFMMDGVRTASDFSDMSANWLVPSGPAFSIWFPIFLLCIAYGVLQALPRNRTRDVFRATGGWSAAGFACICGWALITAFAPDRTVQWASALIFIPAVAALIIAMLKITARKDSLSTAERLMSWLPLSLIAGWCSLAIFLNWTPIAYDVFAGGNANLTSSLLILAAALGLITWALRRSGGNKAYVFPGIWGLAWLSGRHLSGSEIPVIGWAAVIGAGLLVATTFLVKRKI